MVPGIGFVYQVAHCHFAQMAPFSMWRTRQSHCVMVATTLRQPPPTSNNDSTNSFIYCPLLLHTAGMLEPHAIQRWCDEISWFEPFCLGLSRIVHDINRFVQAYAELLQIAADASTAADVAAVDQLRAVAARYPPGSRLGMRCLLPPVLDNDGHIPNLLQDLLLQVYAGLQDASELDRAVTFLREAGHWPSSLQHVPTQALPDAPPDVEAAVGHVPGVPHDPPHGVESSRVPPAGNADNSDPTVRLCPTHLHQHPCEQRRGAQCGTQRRCCICNQPIPHASVFYHCSQGCRFSVCTSCFSPSTHVPVNTGAAQRCASEPPRCTHSHVAQSAPSAGYGRTQLTRYVDMSLDAFVEKINDLIASGSFADLGIPQLKIEGTTAWGAWLRINRRNGALGRRPPLLCGVLFHAANKTVTFHGDAFSAIRSLLPVFRTWTSSCLADLSLPALRAPPLDSASRPDPDSMSSPGGNNVVEVDEHGSVAPNPVVPNAAVIERAVGPSPLTRMSQDILDLQSSVLFLSNMVNDILQALNTRLPGICNQTVRHDPHAATACDIALLIPDILFFRLPLHPLVWSRAWCHHHHHPLPPPVCTTFRHRPSHLTVGSMVVGSVCHQVVRG